MSFSSLALSGRTPVRSQLRRAAKTNVFVYVDWLTSQLIYIHIHTDTVNHTGMDARSFRGAAKTNVCLCMSIG